jgi:hypothetical protein
MKSSHFDSGAISMTLRQLVLMTGFTAFLIGFSDSEAFSAESAKEKKQALKKKLEAERKAELAKKSKPAVAGYSGKSNPDRTPLLVPKAIGKSGDAASVARWIDEQVSATLKTESLTASPRSSDAEFIRRVSLDITGVIPTAERARTFIVSSDPAKRAKLIDELLASPRYAVRQTDVWSNLLIKKSSDNRKVDFSSFNKWLNSQFTKNRPWNEMVADMVMASGVQDTNPAVGFFLSNNGVDKMADEVGKLFLGQSIQCAQCHNHPFTDYKQSEYWALANFFVKTVAGGLNTNKGGEPGVQEVNGVRRGKKNELPESYQEAMPTFLRSDSPKLSATEPYRPVLAKWLSSPTNPYLAKAMVNRTWAQFFGMGLVNPLDDMRPENESTHPALLNSLAADFSANGFDLKHLIRSICNSDAYQRSTASVPGNADAETILYARQTIRVMTPEQLFDSLSAATGVSFGGDKESKKTGGGKYGPNSAREQFTQFFLAGAETANTVDYEPGIPQVLKLMNAKLLNSSRITTNINRSGSPEKTIEDLYLAAFSRRPTDAETAKLIAYVKANGSTSEAWGDVAWVLVNSSEFTVIR